MPSSRSNLPYRTCSGVQLAGPVKASHIIGMTKSTALVAAVMFLSVGCGGAVSEDTTPEPMALSAGGWVQTGDCVDLVNLYGPWPRATTCPPATAECDGSESNGCEVVGSSCEDVQCVTGPWGDDGEPACLPAC